MYQAWTTFRTLWVWFLPKIGTCLIHGEPTPKGFFMASETIYRYGNMEGLTAKEAVQQLHEAVAPKYAVFMRSPSGTRAKFKYLHDSLDSAIEKCREYAADMASIGHLDFTYYAIEIKHRVGIEHGKIVDDPLK